MLDDDVFLNIFRHNLDETPRFWRVCVPKMATNCTDITPGSKSSAPLYAWDSRIEGSKLLANLAYSHKVRRPPKSQSSGS
jgi:hypothetical protein